MKVDIIISILNGEDYIKEAVDSILKQTYQKWHLYLINNGSSDKTLNIIKKLQLSNTDKISVINYEKNEKPSFRWMQIINASQAEAIAISCHDDNWEQNKLEAQVGVLNSMNVDICHTNIKMIDYSSKLIKGGPDIENKYRNKVNYLNSDNKDLSKELCSKNSIRLSSVLIRKSIFEKYGGWEPGIWGGEDWALWTKFSAENCKFYLLNNELTLRRVHIANNSSTSAFTRSFGFLEVIEILSKKYPFLKNDLLEKKNQIYERITLLALKKSDYITSRKYSKILLKNQKYSIRLFIILILSHCGYLGKIILKLKNIKGELV